MGDEMDAASATKRIKVEVKEQDIETDDEVDWPTADGRQEKVQGGGSSYPATQADASRAESSQADCKPVRVQSSESHLAE